MNHGPADIVRQLLIDLGYVSMPTSNDVWPAFVGLRPDTPDDCVALYDVTGVLLGRVQNTGDVAQHYGIQLRVRSPNSQTCQLKVMELERALNTEVYRTPVTIVATGTGTGQEETEYEVHALTQRGAPIFLGKDALDRERYNATLNYTVGLRQLS